MNKPTFESHAEATIKRATATFGQRGEEYGDSWAKPSTKMLDAVAKKMGFTIPLHAKRALMLAVLVDVKYSRLEGGYKDDSVLDGINYMSALAEEMRQFEEADQRRKPVQPVAEIISEVVESDFADDKFQKVIDIKRLGWEHPDLELTILPDWYYKLRDEPSSQWTKIGTNPPEHLHINCTVYTGCAFMYILGIPKVSTAEPKSSSQRSQSSALDTCPVCGKQRHSLACCSGMSSTP